MIPLTAQQAFEAYESIRDRLPPAKGDRPPPVHMDTLADLANRFDVFLLDAFGVLNIGETAIPETGDRVAALRQAGKRVLVVSNAAGMPHAALIEKYARLGFDFAPDDVITSRTALLAELGSHVGTHWGVMASHNAGLTLPASMPYSILEDDPALFDTVDGFLLVGSLDWTEPRQDLLERALRDRPRPVLVGNPDIVAPRDTGFSTEPGHFAHRLADATGVSPQFFGKPFQNIYDIAFARLGPVDRARVLMVGDSLHTDILGAQTAGIASALVSDFGFFAGEDVKDAIARSGIRPDFVIRRP